MRSSSPPFEPAYAPTCAPPRCSTLSPLSSSIAAGHPPARSAIPTAAKPFQCGNNKMMCEHLASINPQEDEEQAGIFTLLGCHFPLPSEADDLNLTVFTPTTLLSPHLLPPSPTTTAQNSTDIEDTKETTPHIAIASNDLAPNPNYIAPNPNLIRISETATRHIKDILNWRERLNEGNPEGFSDRVNWLLWHKVFTERGTEDDTEFAGRGYGDELPRPNP